MENHMKYPAPLSLFILFFMVLPFTFCGSVRPAGVPQLGQNRTSGPIGVPQTEQKPDV